MMESPKTTTWFAVPSIVLFELMVLLPMVALAIYLNRYHRQ